MANCCQLTSKASFIILDCGSSGSRLWIIDVLKHKAPVVCEARQRWEYDFFDLIFYAALNFIDSASVPGTGTNLAIIEMNGIHSHLHIIYVFDVS